MGVANRVWERAGVSFRSPGSSDFSPDFSMFTPGSSADGAASHSRTRSEPSVRWMAPCSPSLHFHHPKPETRGNGQHPLQCGGTFSIEPQGEGKSVDPVLPKSVVWQDSEGTHLKKFWNRTRRRPPPRWPMGGSTWISSSGVDLGAFTADGAPRSPKALFVACAAYGPKKTKQKPAKYKESLGVVVGEVNLPPSSSSAG